MSALFDFPSLLVVIILIICTTAFTRSMYPTLFDTPILDSNGQVTDNNKHTGLRGLCWKASRIGERLSPYVAVCCLLMSIHILFIKA